MQHVLQDWWSCDVHASALRAVFTAQCSWISRWYSLSKCLAMSPNVCVWVNLHNMGQLNDPMCFCCYVSACEFKFTLC